MANETPTIKRENTSFLFFAIAIVLASIAHSTQIIEPFISIRMMALAGVMAAYLLVFYFFYKMPFFKIEGKPAQVFFGLLLSFGVWQITTTLLGNHAVEGFLPITKFFLFGSFLFLLFQNFKSTKNLKPFFILFGILGCFHAAFAIFQFFIIDDDSTSFANNLGWLMGHRNLLGSYLSATIFFSIYLFVYKKGSWKIVGFAGVGLSFVGILLSQSRSAWLAFFAAFLVWIILNFLKKGNKGVQIKSIVLPLLALIILSIGAVFLISDGNDRNSFSKRIQSIFAIETAGNEAEPEAGSIAFRVKTWKQSLSMIGDHPVIGVGSGSWKIHIPKYGCSSYQESAGLISRAKAHNEYIHIACENGLIGFLLLMGLILSVVWATSYISNSKDELYILVAALVAISTDALFSFPLDRIAHLMVLAFCLAGILFLSEKEVTPTLFKNKNIALFSLLGIFLFTIFWGTEQYRFEKFTNLSSNYFYNGNYQKAISNGQKAKSPFCGISRKCDPEELFIGMSQQMSGDADTGFKTLEIALKKHPNNARILNALGTLFNAKKEYSTGTPYLEKALELAPDYAIVKKNLIVNYFRTKRYRDCINIAETLNIEDNKTLNSMYLKSFELELLQKNPNWK